MICNCTIFMSLLGIAMCLPFWKLEETSHETKQVPYHGPPAPLNHDGTVALTPEVKHASEVHRAAFVKEFQRLQAAASLAEAHPDRSSRHHDLENDGLYDDGQYKPNYQNDQQDYRQDVISEQEDDGQYKPFLYQRDSYDSSDHHVSYKHKNIPSKLNADGTVAYTPEYKAIAQSLQAAYHRALARHRRSTPVYRGPPAPLNHDGTVAFTNEIKHANAAHHAAFAHEFQRLQAAASLAAAHPDCTSDYNGQDDQKQYEQQQYNGLYNQQMYDGQYNQQQEDDGQYKPHLYDDGHYNPAAHIPAPLNPDGTAAQTPEFRAIAASLQAAYYKALSRRL